MKFHPAVCPCVYNLMRQPREVLKSDVRAKKILMLASSVRYGSRVAVSGGDKGGDKEAAKQCEGER